TPLVDAGVTAPGLDVLIGSGGPILSHHGIRNDITGHVAKYYGKDPLCHPQIRAVRVIGTVRFLVHKRYVTPGINALRRSIEIRGSMTKQIPIAGVLSEHWSMAPLNSIDEWIANGTRVAASSPALAAVS